MEFNKFIEECMSRYSKHGVTSVDMSVWGNICSIYLMRPEGTPDTPGSFRVGLDADVEGPIPTCYGHYKAEMPVDLEKVLACFDELFEDSKNHGPASFKINRNDIN